LAAELSDRLSLESELVASGGGVFEVIADDKLIFSKKSLGRFPEDGEIVDLVQAL
jgi:selenoprotein W-related protein